MVRYVLQAEISYPSSNETSKIKKEFSNEDDAVRAYELAKKYFSEGNSEIRSIFGYSDKDFSFYFRGIPTLWKENIIREQYKK